MYACTHLELALFKYRSSNQTWSEQYCPPLDWVISCPLTQLGNPLIDMSTGQSVIEMVFLGNSGLCQVEN